MPTGSYARLLRHFWHGSPSSPASDFLATSADWKGLRCRPLRWPTFRPSSPTLSRLRCRAHLVRSQLNWRVRRPEIDRPGTQISLVPGDLLVPSAGGPHDVSHEKRFAVLLGFLSLWRASPRGPGGFLKFLWFGRAVVPEKRRSSLRANALTGTMREELSSTRR